MPHLSDPIFLVALASSLVSVGCLAFAARRMARARAFETSPDALLVLRDGRVVDANASGLSLLASVGAELGVAATTLAPELVKDAREVPIGDRWYDVVRSAPGSPADRRTVLAMRDATLRRNAMRAQEEVAFELERLAIQTENMACGWFEFFARVSHEIRTPLAGILGASDLLRDIEDTQSATLVEAVRTSAEGLLRLVDQILDYSRLDQGHVVLESVPCDLPGIAHELEVLFGSIAATRGVDLRVRVETTNTPLGDPLRIKQVLANLVSNAVKFTERGFVELSIVELDDPHERMRLVFTVEDSGRGIPEEALELVFQPFMQQDSTTSRTHGGTGLGLAITDRLVKQMGGTISVRSRPGAGSTFSFELSMRRASETSVTLPFDRIAALKAKHETRLRPGLHVLFVDDHPVNRMVTSTLLEKAGATVVTASSGPEALARLDEDRFDLVLLDYHLVPMDGLEVARRLRAIEPGLPVVMYTADLVAIKHAPSEDTGVRAWLRKPLRMRELLAVLEPLGLVVDARSIVSASRRPRPRLGTEVLEAFAETSASEVVGIREAAQRGDWHAVRELAHGLGGSAAVLGAHALASLCRTIESHALEQRMPLELDHLVIERVRALDALQGGDLSASLTTPL